MASHGNEETLDQLIALYRKTTHMEEKNRVLACLGASCEPQLIEKALKFAISADVRYQDTVRAFKGCVSTLPGRRLSWRFLKENWDELFNRFNDGVILGRLIATVIERFATLEEAEDIKTFFEEHPAPAAERAIKQSLEYVALNHEWLDRDKDNIEKWLTEN